jgi:hypothetical protein
VGLRTEELACIFEIFCKKPTAFFLYFAERTKLDDMVRVILLTSPPSWGFDVSLATALSKTFLLRMLNDS